METAGKDIEHYHERTKHHPRHYARSAGYLDWDTGRNIELALEMAGVAAEKNAGIICYPDGADSFIVNNPGNGSHGDIGTTLS